MHRCVVPQLRNFVVIGSTVVRQHFLFTSFVVGFGGCTMQALQQHLGYGADHDLQFPGGFYGNNGNNKNRSHLIKLHAVYCRSLCFSADV